MNMLRLYYAVTKPIRNRGLDKIGLVHAIYDMIEPKLISGTNTVVPVNGYKLRLRNIKGGIASELLFKQAYEPMTTGVLKHLLPDKQDVIDVGANIGYFTLLMSQRVKGHVWAFEPEETNFQRLEENVALNFCNNVTVYCQAVSDKMGQGALHVSGLESGEHSLVSNRHFIRDQKTELVKLDSLADRPIGLIKTDTEGNDFKVLRGAEQLIRSHPKLILITEFWPAGLFLSGSSPKEFWTYLLARFRYIYVIDEIARQIVPGDLRDAVDRSIKGLSVNLVCSNEQVL